MTTLLAGGIGLSAPVLLSRSPWSAMAGRMTGLSTGILLSTAFLYALPHAFESGAGRRVLCATLLGGLLLFFLLEKCVLMLGSAVGRRTGSGLKLLCFPMCLPLCFLLCLLIAAGPRSLPYALVLASSHFIYVALSALVPSLQKGASAAETLPQLLSVGAGVAAVWCLRSAGPGM